MALIKLYLDMDGVLCDFEGHCRQLFTDIQPGESLRDYKVRTGSNTFWKALRETKGEFWSAMPPMCPDICEIVKDLQSRFDVKVLSSPDRLDPFCIPGKLEWIKKHLGEDIPAIFEKEKQIHVKCNTDILIDDYPKQINNWKEAGGVGILFTGDWHKTMFDCMSQIGKHLPRGFRENVFPTLISPGQCVPFQVVEYIPKVQMAKSLVEDVDNTEKIT